MKTVQVRIPAEQAKKLQEIVPYIPGVGSLNGAVKRAVDLLLEVEGPVWRAAFREAQEKMKRQAA